ncbi:MAG: hypothetical protein LBE84_06040 [Planctomycetota bacterium]|jgi:hypothetical protein|nr:hypothetical protein [Planctomycetota bacterium]
MSALTCEPATKAEVATPSLKRALDRFKPVVLKNGHYRLLADKIMLALTPGRLDLWSAGDLGCDLRMEIPLAGKVDDGRIVVSFRQLLKLVTIIREPFLRLGIDDGRLLVVPGDRPLGMPLPAACEGDDYPAPPEVSQSRETLVLPGKLFAEALSRVAPLSAGNSSSGDYALTRILLEDEPAGGVNLTASDGARLGIAHVAGGQGTAGGGKGFFGFTPREAKMIARLAEEEESVRIACLDCDKDGRTDAVFGRNWRVRIKHEICQWPDWRFVMPDLNACGQALEMETAPLLSALAEMRPLLEGNESNGLMIHPAGQAAEGQATIGGYMPCRDDDKPGRRDLYRVSLPAGRNTLAVAIRFDVNQFESIVKAAGKSFVMRLSSDDAGTCYKSPAHFTSGSFQALLMPLVIA